MDHILSDLSTMSCQTSPAHLGWPHRAWLSFIELNKAVVHVLNIQKTKIMGSGPITSWQIDGETLETVAGFILGGSKITADGDCSHEMKDAYSLERKL